MSEITTEKQAVEALENGADLYDVIPSEFWILEPVILASVKNEGINLCFAYVQSLEICLAAVKNGGEDVLRYIDPEFRTNALLKACGLTDTFDEFKESEPITIGEVAGWESANEVVRYTLYCKGDSDWLHIAQKSFLRYLNNYGYDWEEEYDWRNVWKGRPMEADAYSVEFSSDKSFLKMKFGYGGGCSISLSEFVSRLKEFLKNNPLFCEHNLEFFLICNESTMNSDACGYGIVGPNCIRPTSKAEAEYWSYELGDYEENLAEVSARRLFYIETRFELWLVEGTDDTVADSTSMRCQLVCVFYKLSPKSFRNC